ncbi:hypothetical protein [Paenibacillus alba]|uniref:YtzI protein n=1 Tax=Paenibacillus alba TaxID=1197127 RepID=A0ABU6GAS8_9BACL|nr:hypothetical protein [Paenibacillus alba]MEC0231303.1 hypothetical protein [Paenibacillus alba]
MSIGIVSFIMAIALLAWVQAHKKSVKKVQEHETNNSFKSPYKHPYE